MDITLQDTTRIIGYGGQDGSLAITTYSGSGEIRVHRIKMDAPISHLKFYLHHDATTNQSQGLGSVLNLVVAVTVGYAIVFRCVSFSQ